MLLWELSGTRSRCWPSHKGRNDDPSLLILLAYWGFTEFFPVAPFNPFFRFPVLDVVTFLGVVGSMVVVQVYRYQRVSTPTQRQQTKWVVYGVTMGVGGFLLLISFGRFFPSLFPSSL